MSGKLSVGDKIRFGDKDGALEQVVESMQIEHESIKSAKKGDVIGLKVDEKVSEGAEVYLVE